MAKMRWDMAKNARLKSERGVSFDEMILEGHCIVTLAHPARQHQRVMLFDYRGYVWVVPCVVAKGEIFLKTMFPSRQYTKRWKRGEFYEKNSIE
jgi:hypothetical protein